MQITKLTGFTGAELFDVDLSAITPELGDALRAALANHHVLVARDQYLDLAQQKALTAVFGDLGRLPYVDPIDDDPDVIAVRKDADERSGGVFGGDWHSDFSFLANPPAGSVLCAIDVPPVGGDTVWANQVAAYASLPAALRELVDGRDAIHVGKPYGVRWAPPEAERANASITMRRGDPSADEETAHPAVLVLPETGERALFVNPIYTTRLGGMTEAESEPVLSALYRHATRPDVCMRHRWRPGDVVIWNNRTTMHHATNDYDGVARLLHRTTFVRPDTP